MALASSRGRKRLLGRSKIRLERVHAIEGFEGHRVQMHIPRGAKKEQEPTEMAGAYPGFDDSGKVRAVNKDLALQLHEEARPRVEVL